MTQPAGQDAVITSYQQATAQARDQLTSYLLALWASLKTYRAAQMADFTDQAVPVIEGAMGHMQSLTAAYLATVGSAHSGRSTPYPTKTVGIRSVRNGADPTEVYGRPFHLVWQQLAVAQQRRDAHFDWTPDRTDGTPPALPPADYVQKAIQSGADRVVQSALTDLQLAKTHTVRDVLAQDKWATGYRRVLEGAYSCGLCIVAATQPYRKAKLMPIHPACDCSVEPYYGKLPDTFPAAARIDGQLVDVGNLSDTHRAIRDRFGKSSAGAKFIPGGKGAQYRDVLITHEHGEIGPVLAVRPPRGPRKQSAPTKGGTRRG